MSNPITGDYRKHESQITRSPIGCACQPRILQSPNGWQYTPNMKGRCKSLARGLSEQIAKLRINYEKSLDKLSCDLVEWPDKWSIGSDQVNEVLEELEKLKNDLEKFAALHRVSATKVQKPLKARIRNRVKGINNLFKKIRGSRIEVENLLSTQKASQKAKDEARRQIRSETRSRRTAKVNASRRRDTALRIRSIDNQAGVVSSRIPCFESVVEVVEYAESKFRGHLVFALNGDSHVKGNPFINLDVLWKALECLATIVRDSKLGTSSHPQLADAVLERCGWEYAPNQGKDIRRRKPDAYSTWYKGKQYDIQRHLKFGVGTDARCIMRVAFAWDSKLEKIIVGYIGPHQPTRRS